MKKLRVTKAVSLHVGVVRTLFFRTASGEVAEKQRLPFLFVGCARSVYLFCLDVRKADGLYGGAQRHPRPGVEGSPIRGKR